MSVTGYRLEQWARRTKRHLIREVVFDIACVDRGFRHYPFRRMQGRRR